MRIAWFTPFSQKSAIGLYSKYACEALQDLYEIQIFTPSSDTLHQTMIPVKQFSSVEQIPWDKFDLCFYNIGDNSNFHSQIVDCIFHHPGILVLHDRSIINLWLGYYIAYKGEHEHLYQLLSQYYGTNGCSEILAAMHDIHKWAKLDMNKYSGLEIIAPYAKGILVHSEYHASFVKKKCKCPVQIAYFPYPCEWSPAEAKEMPEKIELLTVGNVNYNKRITQVIEAIGTEKKLAKHIRYTVAGGLGNEVYVQMLQERINKYQLQDSVILRGYTPEGELEELYRQSDILINLRNPALEGASWSLVEQMCTGKPIIVSDTGFYAEIPRDCVYHITTEEQDEVQDIQKALLWMMENWDAAKEMGTNAYSYAKEFFSPEQYAEKVNNLIDTMAFQKPLEQLVNFVCHEFQCMGLKADMSICKEYANEIEHLFLHPGGKVPK